MSEKTQRAIVYLGATLIGSIVAVSLGQVLGFTNDMDFSEVWLMTMTAIILLINVTSRD